MRNPKEKEIEKFNKLSLTHDSSRRKKIREIDQELSKLGEEIETEHDALKLLCGVGPAARLDPAKQVWINDRGELLIPKD